MRSIVQFIGFYEGKDVYEQKDLVPSYIIKTAALHAIGHVSQKEWNTASLASLYAYTFCHIYLNVQEISSYGNTKLMFRILATCCQDF